MRWALTESTARRSALQGRSCGAAPISSEPTPQPEADVAGVGLVPRRAMAAQDIRNLQPWTCQQRRALGGHLGLGLVFSLLLGRVFGLGRTAAGLLWHDRGYRTVAGSETGCGLR